MASDEDVTRRLVPVLLAIAGCNSPGDDPGPALPVDPAALYQRSCARCHGADGRGDPQMRMQLPVRDFSDPAFRARPTADVEQVIMAGRAGMPPFGGQLSQPKIQSLAGYVRRLGAAAAAAAR